MAQSASVPPLGEPRALRARAGANRLLLLIQMDIQMGIAHFNLIFRKHSLDSLVHLEINVPVVLGFCPEAKNIANGTVIIGGKRSKGCRVLQHLFHLCRLQQSINHVLGFHIIGGRNLDFRPTGSSNSIIGNLGGRHGAVGHKDHLVVRVISRV